VKKRRDTIQGRLKYWLTDVEGVSLRRVHLAVNEQLPEKLQVSLTTMSNYTRGEVVDVPGPRAEVLVALKKAFPDLNLAWLLFGRGMPTEAGEATDVQLQGFAADVRESVAPSKRHVYDVIMEVVDENDLPAEVRQVLAGFLFRKFSEDDGDAEKLQQLVRRYLDRHLYSVLHPTRLLTRAELAASTFSVLSALYLREFGGSPELAPVESD
jgi:hypothetical protein